MQTSRFSTLRLGAVGLFVLALLQQGCGVDKPADVVAAESRLPAKIDFNRHVKPILSDKCFFCHGPDKKMQKGGLELATAEGARAALKSGHRAIVPGSLRRSEAYYRLVSTDPEEVMPPPHANRALSAYEKAVLVKWIEQGAEYQPHWALTKPVALPLPAVKNRAWPRNGIDFFVLNNLQANGLSPSTEADRETLLRRVSLDLTGIAPTPAETDAFLADRSPNAYEKVVDRLLRSPRYGERLATDWMDLARFADTHGYTVDRYRPAWPYRDWVIRAFNQNLPYDQFVTWQLAGDLLPHPTRDQRIATAFNRVHAQNMEGGIVNEEFRVEYVADRTNTLGTAFLGLTVECARCHDHKYDPISQKDYYRLFAFFNNVDEAGQISWDDAMPVPTLLLTEPKHDSLLRFFDEKITTVETALAQTRRGEEGAFQTWKKKVGTTLPIDLKAGLQAHFPFDGLEKGTFVNAVSRRDSGRVADPVLVAGRRGQAFRSNGDDVLTLGPVGIFNRAQPFTVGAWVKIPKGLTQGVLFHKGDGDITFDFRGYYLTLRGDRLELLMAHTWPYNALRRVSRQPIPRERWVHVAMTYDGSSRAAGLRLYVDGLEAPLLTERDNLYKDILFAGPHPGLSGRQPGLQLGADLRGPGLKNGAFDDLTIHTRELTAPEVAALAGQTPTVTSEAARAFFSARVSTGEAALRRQLDTLRRRRNAVVETIPELMVIEDLKQPRPTYLLKRGVYNAPGERVQPDAPRSILPFPEQFPKNRLGLARWLLHPDHPLTARVAVNRYWQMYFGRGLHATTNNFGNQGGLPTHPELLDWLAVQFRTSGWNVKALQKLIVMSATYRQSSAASPALRQRDPANDLLARGPAFRLTAEQVRDNALAASGLLSGKIGGPSVKPYQPEGLWAVNRAEYVQDHGPDLYRRSLYTFWRRTNPPPSMNTFDAPSRSYCVVQRQQTNTPLQALVLLNDPQFVEAARVLAQHSVAEAPDAPGRIEAAFRRLTARRPTDWERTILTALYNREREKFARFPAKQTGWLRTGEAPDPQGSGPDLAALTVVTSTIMNSDAFITRR
jgi:hypothetical protein